MDCLLYWTCEKFRTRKSKYNRNRRCLEMFRRTEIFCYGHWLISYLCWKFFIKITNISSCIQNTLKHTCIYYLFTLFKSIYRIQNVSDFSEFFFSKIQIFHYKKAVLLSSKRKFKAFYCNERLLRNKVISTCY